MSDPIQLLKDLITSASVSLSPSVAWWAFYANWRARQEERSVEARRLLDQVKKELEYIKMWAKNEYPDSEKHPEWRDPFWSVRDFPSEHIHEINYATSAIPDDDRLRDALASLETAITRFRALLGAHRQFVLRLGADPGTIAKPGWTERLYELNEKIHVEGIGTASDPDGLHSTWKRAVSEVERVLAGPVRVVRPGLVWNRVGNCLAVILTGIGAVFLASFIMEAVNSISLPCRYTPSGCRGIYGQQPAGSPPVRSDQR